MILRNLNKISNFHKTQHVYTKRKGIQENNDFAHKKSLLSVKQIKRLHKILFNYFPTTKVLSYHFHLRYFHDFLKIIVRIL